MKICNACEKTRPDKHEFCTECGAPLEEARECTLTTGCKTQLAPTWKYCPGCGVKTDSPGSVNKVTMTVTRISKA